MLHFPNITPIAFEVLGFPIRWYSLSYLIGIILTVLLVYVQNKKVFSKLGMVEDLVFYGTLGIIIGGRIGYVAIYGLQMVETNWLNIFKIWQGGMSFHGAVVGLIVGLHYYCKKYQIWFFSLTDQIVRFAPLGLLLGRLANFINQELYGRPTNVSWGIIFPYVDGVPRHPSQLYEAFGEGLFLLCILNLIYCYKKLNIGTLTGLFVTLYSIIRFIIEFFREPDQDLGLYYGILTMGQLLSFPMLILGLYIIFYKRI